MHRLQAGQRRKGRMQQRGGGGNKWQTYKQHNSTDRHTTHTHTHTHTHTPPHTNNSDSSWDHKQTTHTSNSQTTCREEVSSNHRHTTHSSTAKICHSNSQAKENGRHSSTNSHSSHSKHTTHTHNTATRTRARGTTTSGPTAAAAGGTQQQHSKRHAAAGVRGRDGGRTRAAGRYTVDSKVAAHGSAADDTDGHQSSS
jgi:hypothetical protein